jgi:hypothetical protein
VSFPLSTKQIAYWQESMHSFIVERDEIRIGVGGSSDQLPMHTTVKVIP